MWPSIHWYIARHTARIFAANLRNLNHAWRQLLLLYLLLIVQVVPAVAPPSYQVSVGAAGSVAFVAAPVKPDYPGAHTFIVLAVTVTITCAIFNPLSLFFGVPALALAVLVCMYVCMYVCDKRIQHNNEYSY